MKKLFCFLLALGLLVGTCASYVAAHGSGHASVARVEYEGNGKVDVDFHGRVAYNNPVVTVKDADGKKYSAKILERDSDDLDFKADGVRSGKTYTFTISGIQKSGTSAFTSVSGRFTVPSVSKVTINELDYDAEDRELSVEFAHRVHYSGTKLTLKDSAGNKITVTAIEKENDEMELRTARLQRGKKYTLTISGIKHQSANAYTSVTKSFTA